MNRYSVELAVQSMHVPAYVCLSNSYTAVAGTRSRAQGGMDPGRAVLVPAHGCLGRACGVACSTGRAACPMHWGPPPPRILVSSAATTPRPSSPPPPPPPTPHPSPRPLVSRPSRKLARHHFSSSEARPLSRVPRAGLRSARRHARRAARHLLLLQFRRRPLRLFRPGLGPAYSSPCLLIVPTAAPAAAAAARPGPSRPWRCPELSPRHPEHELHHDRGQVRCAPARPSVADGLRIRYVGLALAMSSALAIGKPLPPAPCRRAAPDRPRPGTSFVITKKVRRPSPLGRPCCSPILT